MKPEIDFYDFDIFSDYIEGLTLETSCRRDVNDILKKIKVILDSSLEEDWIWDESEQLYADLEDDGIGELSESESQELEELLDAETCRLLFLIRALLLRLSASQVKKIALFALKGKPIHSFIVWVAPNNFVKQQIIEDVSRLLRESQVESSLR